MSEQQRSVFIAVIILAILSLAGSAYYYFMFGKPEIERVEKEIGELEKDKRELEIKIASYLEFLERREEIEQTVEAIRLATQRLPNSPNDTTYVQLVTDFLQKTGVQLQSIIPQGNNDYNYYTELPNFTEGTTRYDEFVQFLSLAEQNSSLFVRANSFKLLNDDESPTVHPFELTLSTFLFND